MQSLRLNWQSSLFVSATALLLGFGCSSDDVTSSADPGTSGTAVESAAGEASTGASPSVVGAGGETGAPSAGGAALAAEVGGAAAGNGTEPLEEGGKRAQAGDGNAAASPGGAGGAEEVADGSSGAGDGGSSREIAGSAGVAGTGGVANTGGGAAFGGAAAFGGSASGTGGAQAGSGGTAGVAGNVGSGGGSSGGSLPCDVAAVLQARCQTCHKQPPVNKAPMSLLTWSAVNKYADAIQEKLDADLMPPPGAPDLTAQQLETLLTYVSLGAPSSGNASCP